MDSYSCQDTLAEFGFIDERHSADAAAREDVAESRLPLRERVEAFDSDLGAEGRSLFYCATPPSPFPTIVARIGDGGLGDHARIVLEKPIGHDLASARELARVVLEVFDESGVFRIDHYVGKAAVQNILVFRFANSMVERAWCGEAVDHVQITVADPRAAEELIEPRAWHPS